MRILVISMVTLFLGCTETDNESNGTATALEGTWASICVDQSLSFSGQTGSNDIVTNYNGNNIGTTVNTYTDTGCTQLESVVEASQSTLFVSPGQTPKSFTVGSSIQTSNGADATEIDIVNIDGNTQLNIFLLQNNNSTLHFGLPLCPINNPSCGIRPTEINYVFPYTKIN